MEGRGSGAQLAPTRALGADRWPQEPRSRFPEPPLLGRPEEGRPCSTAEKAPIPTAPNKGAAPCQGWGSGLHGSAGGAECEGLRGNWACGPAGTPTRSTPDTRGGQEARQAISSLGMAGTVTKGERVGGGFLLWGETPGGLGSTDSQVVGPWQKRAVSNDMCSLKLAPGTSWPRSQVSLSQPPLPTSLAPTG